MLRKHHLNLLLAAVLVLSMIVPQFVEACECAYASVIQHDLSETTPPDSTDSRIPENCCAGGDGQPSPSASFFVDAEDQKVCYSKCDTHPDCCLAENSTPNPTMDKYLVGNGPRSPIKELQVQQALPSAFIPLTESCAIRSTPATTLKSLEIAIHIPSTVLLL